tara:strand:- start:71859 stop:72071 length:213 start_codon:yes stop_codon:yes gene_type:complete
MEELFFNSSNLDSGQYDKKNKKLYITFVRSGDTYCYTKVPEIIKENLMNAPSQGKYFAQNIQKNYNYTKV